MFRPVAKNVVASMTFHNVKTIERYFGTVLHIPPVWPIEPLGIIADWRNDLVHRNGVDEHDVPRVISAQQLQNALQKVSDLIEAADHSLRLEVDYFGNWRNEENREIIAGALRISRRRIILMTGLVTLGGIRQQVLSYLFLSTIRRRWPCVRWRSFRTNCRNTCWRRK
jgi:hypothetical protein